MPSDQKIWMGYEAHPNEYVKSEDGGFDRKPEYRAEQEARLGGGDPDDAAAQERAVERKRLDRRTTPLDSVELQAALNKARIIANALQEANDEAQAQTRQAEIDSWVARQARA